MKKAKKITTLMMKTLNIVAITILLLLLAVNLYTIISKYVFKNDLPKVFGFANAIVVTGSMRDTIEPGDLLIIKEKEEYNVGDIITYCENDDMITHRIIEINETGYITKGDANNTADAEIDFEQIEGKTILIIPSLGSYIAYLKTPRGLLVLIAFVVLSLLLSSLLNKMRANKQKNEQ